MSFKEVVEELVFKDGPPTKLRGSGVDNKGSKGETQGLERASSEVESASREDTP